MKNVAKLCVVLTFGLVAMVVFLSEAGGVSPFAVGAQATVTPTPANTANTAANAANRPANANMAVNSATPLANTAATPTPSTPPAGNKKIPKEFTLGKLSLSEYGEVAFDHDTHAFHYFMCRYALG